MSSALFDTHAHLNDPRFEGEERDVLARMAEQGVTRCVCVGSDIDTSLTSIERAQQTQGVYAAVGVHPHEAKDAAEGYLNILRDLLKRPKVVALGEIGLDYHYDLSPRNIQRDVFAEQLELAYQEDVPVILHIREAHGEAIDLLRARAGRLRGGIVHCYTGSAESTRDYLSMGLYISFSGSVTFKNAKNLREAAKAVPLDRLLIETDSPYLAPEPMRGRRNEPGYVRYVLLSLAETLGMDADALAAITYTNAMNVYRLTQAGSFT